MRTARARNSSGYLFPKFFFSITQYPYFRVSGKQGAVHGGAEQKIRKYLVDNNFVETVIALAPNLFFGTTIAVNILVLAKHKSDTKVQFIDATGEEFFRKGTNINIMEDRHIAEIIKMLRQQRKCASRRRPRYRKAQSCRAKPSRFSGLRRARMWSMSSSASV